MRRGKVLVVADEPGTTEALTEALGFAGLDTLSSKMPNFALDQLCSEDFDLLVLDLKIAREQGDGLLKHAIDASNDLAILLLAGPSDIPLAVRCLREGAADYVVQPFDLQEVAVRASRALEFRALRKAERERSRELEQRVQAQGEQLMGMLRSSLRTLTHALEAKDRYTRNHSERVADLAVEIAQVLYPGDLEFHEKVRLGALLHDIGKIGISEAALNHPGAITEEMFLEIKKHPIIGEEILIPLIPDPEILCAVRNHHERFDGSGYPDGLSGTQISLTARIVAVADAYDAMVSSRPFRSAKSKTEALSILTYGSGTQWDPEIVGAALQALGEMQFA